MNKIQRRIRNADIPLGSAIEGDCGAIARAIKSVFGGEYAVFLDDDEMVRHAAVLIDGKLYDGTGVTTLEGMFLSFTDREEPYTESFENVEDCPHIRLEDSISNFRHQPDLTNSVVKALKEDSPPSTDRP